jgi:hypothetical protein
MDAQLKEQLAAAGYKGTRFDLEELIEAVGFAPDIFTHEITLKKFAYGEVGYRYVAFVCCQQLNCDELGEPLLYSTPTEAVAKLWLALNQK